MTLESAYYCPGTSEVGEVDTYQLLQFSALQGSCPSSETFSLCLQKTESLPEFLPKQTKKTCCFYPFDGGWIFLSLFLPSPG